MPDLSRTRMPDLSPDLSPSLSRTGAGQPVPASPSRPTGRSRLA